MPTLPTVVGPRRRANYPVRQWTAGTRNYLLPSMGFKGHQTHLYLTSTVGLAQLHAHHLSLQSLLASFICTSSPKGNCTLSSLSGLWPLDKDSWASGSGTGGTLSASWTGSGGGSSSASGLGDGADSSPTGSLQPLPLPPPPHLVAG